MRCQWCWDRGQPGLKDSFCTAQSTLLKMWLTLLSPKTDSHDSAKHMLLPTQPHSPFGLALILRVLGGSRWAGDADSHIAHPLQNHPDVSLATPSDSHGIFGHGRGWKIHLSLWEHLAHLKQNPPKDRVGKACPRRVHSCLPTQLMDVTHGQTDTQTPLATCSCSQDAGGMARSPRIASGQSTPGGLPGHTMETQQP